MSNSPSIIKTISEFHQIFSLDKPKHPSISFVQLNEIKNNIDERHANLEMDLFVISMKDGSCGYLFGRKSYDFAEGVMTFTEPSLMFSRVDENCLKAASGWFLIFSIDLLKNTILFDQIDNYNFFFYNNSEALHLSGSEQQVILNCVGLIVKEIDERIDNHSNTVIISTLNLLLNLCSRFYDRQFNTRSIFNKETLNNVDFILEEYYTKNKLVKFGLPKKAFIADELDLSENYINDLILKETKRNTQNYILDFIIEKAKVQLVKNDDSIESISQNLGFKFLNYFERSFKLNTGMSPLEFRQLFK
ncbi:helix-turn-helix domain-containing protein [uncultured Tenacibaculum sp.]|uniref:helix-turn-helix domain-containing protein n=1 Tax=uncultured Tenacibaculum sp. TaxID=174713 RepID=UPI0026326870|nr:helix-turn-helix domain-containing protein [uncultured Tenacibaculum sp.]